MERSYDERGRLVHEKDDAQTTAYAYDRSGRLVSTRIEIEDEQGQAAPATTLRTAYGPDGEPEAKTLADGRTMRIERTEATGTAKRIALQSAFWAAAHERIGQWLPESIAPPLQRLLPQDDIARDIAFPRLRRHHRLRRRQRHRDEEDLRPGGKSHRDRGEGFERRRERRRQQLTERAPRATEPARASARSKTRSEGRASSRPASTTTASGC